MSVIKWDQMGDKKFELGVKNCVLYTKGTEASSKDYDTAEAWNGITGITETPSGADEQAMYADDIKYATVRGTENFGGTIKAYTYPDLWAECDGSAAVIKGVTIGQQKRKVFGLSYVTTVGNDTDGMDHSEKIHLVYGCTASPSGRDYATINESPNGIEFSWEFTTVPVSCTYGGVEYKPVSIMTIDTKDVSPAGLKALKDALYGTEAKDAYLPLPADVFGLLQTA